MISCRCRWSSQGRQGLPHNHQPGLCANTLSPRRFFAENLRSTLYPSARRHRQRPDPAQQVPEQPPVEMALCQEQPVVAGMLSFIAQAVDAERQCSRFLRFQVTVEPDGGPVRLDLSGPPGAREFLAQMIEG